jgi:glutathione synthase/RimK-type ligase-like ATP-grasp enzyme
MEMKRKILYLNCSRIDKGQKFIGDLSLSKAEVANSSLTDLIFQISGGQPRIFDKANQCDISQYDIVIFRNTHILYKMDLFIAVSYYLRHFERKVIGDISLSGALVGKISQMILFALNGIAVPDTIMSIGADGHKDIAQSGIGQPFIFKANAGIKGLDNYLLDDYSESQKIAEASGGDVFLAQKYIKNDGDWRVLCVGQQPPLFIKRSSSGQSHLNNTSRGATAEIIEPNKMPAEVRRLARQIRRLVKTEIIGIDLIQDLATGQWAVLEVNTTPALYSGAFLGQKTRLLENFLDQEAAK